VQESPPRAFSGARRLGAQQVEKVHSEGEGKVSVFMCVHVCLCVCVCMCMCVCKRERVMNREEHYYGSQVFKDSCLYQRPPAEDFCHSPPPPCLYMSRPQVHSVYSAPSLGGLEPAGLPDVMGPYAPLREDSCVMPQLHVHPGPLQQQQSVPSAGGYAGEGGDVTLCADRNRYHLQFPWMKTTKSHSHTWKGQWTGNIQQQCDL